MKNKFIFRILVFVCLLPLFTIIIFNLTIGKSPEPLNLGVVNYESLSQCSYQSIDVCDGQIPISCKYINEMGKQGLNMVINKLYVQLNIEINLST